MKKNHLEWKAFWGAMVASLVFTVIIQVAGRRFDTLDFLPDAGAAWYYWKLPVPTFWGRFSAWGLYVLHQISIWFIVARAVKEKPHPGKLSRWNYAAIGVNGLFIVLHFLQTHLEYDGLAQDVPIWTSQYSVIVMLVIMLVMLMPRRGLFWGKKIALPQKGRRFLAKTHGFYISWALVYTFWFHPMDNDFGMLIGFLYMFFLFIQLSFFNTKVHVSNPWIIFLEVFVAFHGTMVAIMNQQPMWTMFLFGFLFMFVFTQMHGLKLPGKAKIAVLAAYIAGIVIAYSFRGYNHLYELSFIPAALYGGALALWGAVALGSRLFGGKKQKGESS